MQGISQAGDEAGEGQALVSRYALIIQIEANEIAGSDLLGQGVDVAVLSGRIIQQCNQGLLIDDSAGVGNA